LTSVTSVVLCPVTQFVTCFAVHVFTPFQAPWLAVTSLLPSFLTRIKIWLAHASLHVLSQRVFMCRLYQTDFTLSALATDNRSFILFTTSI